MLHRDLCVEAASGDSIAAAPYARPVPEGALILTQLPGMADRMTRVIEYALGM